MDDVAEGRIREGGRTMSESKEAPSTRRREFLKLAGLGSVSGAAAMAGLAGSAKAAEAEAPSASGYRETPHVKKVYELSRF
jgi:hypothetical protein